ncbi:MAG TPA: protease inhibitor [Polyangiaceae bacterium]|nr:protease inhibitor [Polyangiaceae bacterium]
MLPSKRIHFATIATFALLALPAAKGGCGSDVPIGQDDDTCGGIAGIQCGAGEFCDWEQNTCGIADELGTCKPLPQACSEIYQPVCGCDGQTYGNACEANASGISVASDGECDPGEGGGGQGGGGQGGGGQGGGGQGGGGPESCGGIAGIQCDPGEFCDYPDMSCGIADELGVCTPLPQACNEIYDPVCGCDGETYGNACAANLAGVSVGSSGECPSSGDPCGGIAGLECGADEFCDYPDMSCGIADELGVCTTKPQACNEIYQPVCGCDGQTYGNACAANLAGVSVGSSGPC